MNTQLDEIASQREYRRPAPAAARSASQVENFGNRIAGTAGQIAESIVTGIISDFEDSASGFSAEAVQGAVAFDETGAAVEDFDRTLAEQITDFSTQMNAAFGALAGLRATQQTLEGAGLPGGMVGSQIDRLTDAMSDASRACLHADCLHRTEQPLHRFAASTGAAVDGSGHHGQ